VPNQKAILLTGLLFLPATPGSGKAQAVAPLFTRNATVNRRLDGLNCASLERGSVVVKRRPHSGAPALWRNTSGRS
jgi:hypothetical protein